MENTTWLVGVQHIDKGRTTQAYWFKVKPELCELKRNDWVLVDTCYGPATGRVAHEPILLTREKDFNTLYSALGCLGEVKEVMQKIEYSGPVAELPF